MSLDNKHKALLQKLISGTISDHEQWQLERASLDDPFLADALEGFHLNETKKDDLATINNKLRSKSPIPKSKTRNLWRKRLTIAASLIVLMGASLWMFQESNPSDLMTAENTSIQTSSKQIKSAGQASKTAAPEDSSDDIESREEQQLEKVFKNESTEKGTDIKEYLGDVSKQQVSNSSQQKDKLENSSAPPAPASPTKNLDEVLTDYEESFPEEAVMEEVKVVETKAPILEKDIDISEDIIIAEEELRMESQTERNAKDLNTPTARKKAKSRMKSKKESAEIIPADPQIDLSALANAGPIESLPTISKGVVLNSEGTPLPGVEILDLENNKLVVTDASGAFFLPEMNGYVITAFAGYDSMTVAITPNLSIQLQESSKALTQPLKRLVDMMDDGELRTYYVNELNVLFSKHWPICSRTNNFDVSQTSGMGRQLKNNTTVHIVVSDNGKIFDTTFYDELDEQCAAKISDLLTAAEAAELFVIGRPTSFTYRINF